MEFLPVESPIYKIWVLPDAWTIPKSSRFVILPLETPIGLSTKFMFLIFLPVESEILPDWAFYYDMYKCTYAGFTGSIIFNFVVGDSVMVDKPIVH